MFHISVLYEDIPSAIDSPSIYFWFKLFFFSPPNSLSPSFFSLLFCPYLVYVSLSSFSSSAIPPLFLSPLLFPQSSSHVLFPPHFSSLLILLPQPM